MYAKYKNKKLSTPDGMFDSKKEYLRFCQLKIMEQDGKIKDLQRQVKYELIPRQAWHKPVKSRSGKRMYNFAPPIEYVADFTYIHNGELVVEDVKGFITQVYEIKKKLMLYVHGIQIKEV